MRVGTPGRSGRHRPGSVLFAGQAYYNAWYLSRELRKLGWRADVLNWDPNPSHDIYYHGEDFRLETTGDGDLRRHLRFYLKALRSYDVFHFSNAHSIQFSAVLHDWCARRLSEGAEIRLLKRLGKKVVYSNNGCLDGVSQSSFASWGDRPVCEDCAWRNVPAVCSDERNLDWGRFRNSVADFQVLIGGNRADFNDDPRVHEVPEFYCLDPDLWRPDLEIPDRFRLDLPESTLKIYHAVGNFDTRSDPESFRNIKSSHIYVPLIKELKEEGHDIEMIFFQDVPNTELRYYQAQADIVVDMLTYGWFGASAREAMMLGKPVVCYLREEWLEQMHREVPEYVEQLPIVSATPDTVREVLIDLIENPEKRREIGRRSREFAVRWHSAEVAARRFDRIYSGLLDGLSGSDPSL
jgi:glycosyltransferase involved in cell wall biosynthesis